MIVVSLFNGCSGAHLALNMANIPVTDYYYSEIDKFANQITALKFPKAIPLGDVYSVKGFYCDLLIFGSPCQGFSIAGNRLNFHDERSKLFFEAYRILQECRAINPNVKFLMENVASMNFKVRDIISTMLDVEPLRINSELVSAQCRDRLYWTNIAMGNRGLFSFNYCTIPQPADQGIFLKDILEPNEDIDPKYYLNEKAIARIFRKTFSDPKIKLVTLSNMRIGNDKALSLGANDFKGIDNNGQRTIVCINPTTAEGTQTYQQDRIYDVIGKIPCLMADLSSGTHAICINGNTPQIINGTILRRLTPLECCRLQTMPDDFYFTESGEQILSDTQVYKQTGNGFTISVIAHILSYLK